MPKLNEYIGSIVSSITNARVMSDVQTVKVAEEYSKHNLLKYFSIPRMKIEDIEMTIPVALEEINEKTESEYQPVDIKKFDSVVYREFVNNLGLTKLKEDISLKLKDMVSKQTNILMQNISNDKNLSYLKNYCKDISNLEKNVLLSKHVIKRKMNTKEMSQHLENILISEFKISRQKKIADDLNVIVEAHKLREQKPENIIYIKLKIREDGLEWDRSEKPDGSIESKLLPE